MTVRSSHLAITALLLACNSSSIMPTGGNSGGGNSGGGNSGGGNAGGGNSGGGNSGGGAGGQAGFFTFPDAGPPTDALRNGGDVNCGLTTVKLEMKPPEIMMVFDRSSSMNMIVPGTMSTRFAEAMAAITDVLAKTNATVSWGLKLFPTGQDCMVTPGVEVPIGAMTGPMVTAGIMGLPPGMPIGTPTHLAVDAATAQLKTRTTTNPKYLLLTTDGEPNCNGGAQASVASIRAAATAGFHTFVVGIATAGTDADNTLNEMATAGLEPRMGATKYYPASVRDELSAALTQITGQVTNCIFPLTAQPPSPDDVAVRVGTMRIDRNMTSGWQYGMGMSSVVLYGAACDLAKSGKAGEVQIIFGCPNTPIP
jgi:hypothetical protein